MSYAFNLPPDGAPHLEPSDDTHQLVLVKQGQRYVFDCPPGGEAAVIERLHQLVDDPANDFNWFDAAVISHQVGQLMAGRLSDLHCRKKLA